MVARLAIVRGFAEEGTGEDATQRGLARPVLPAKSVGLMEASAFADKLAKDLHRGVLTENVGVGLRTVAGIEGHGRSYKTKGWTPGRPVRAHQTGTGPTPTKGYPLRGVG